MKNIKKKLNIMSWILIILFVCSYILGKIYDTYGFHFITLIYTLYFISYKNSNFICPNCNEYLGKDEDLNYCKNCGYKLED